MKKLYAFAILAMQIATACVPQQALTQTAVAQTQIFQMSMATGLAGTMTASAPTATNTLPPPTSTVTPLPSPTASGTYGFSNVSVKQAGDDAVDVSFNFQIKAGTKLGEIYIGAIPEGCGKLLFSMSYRPYIPSAYSGSVGGDEAIRVSLDKPGTCSAKSVLVFVFVPNSTAGNLYQKSFPFPVTLTKK